MSIDVSSDLNGFPSKKSKSDGISQLIATFAASLLQAVRQPHGIEGGDKERVDDRAQDCLSSRTRIHMALAAISA